MVIIIGVIKRKERKMECFNLESTLISQNKKKLQKKDQSEIKLHGITIEKIIKSKFCVQKMVMNN